MKKIISEHTENEKLENRVVELETKLDNDTINFGEVKELLSHKNYSFGDSCVDIDLIKNDFVVVNHLAISFKNLSLGTLGRFLKLLTLITYKNEVVKKVNHRKSSAISKSEIMEFLEMKSPTIFIKTFKKLEEAELLYRKQIKGKGFIVLINPIYANRGDAFTLTKDLLDAFKKDIINNIETFKNAIKDFEIFNILNDVLEEKLSKSDYLSLKSRFYKSSLFNLDNNLNGVYRLYKNNEIIYIGKSKNIKNRLLSHNYDKDFDSLDYVEIDNNADKDLYEMYYIDKFKPILNKEYNYNYNHSLTVELPELVFCNIIKNEYLLNN